MDSIVEVVLHHGRTNPDKLCLADDSHTVSYQEYCGLFGRMATVFKDLGVGSGVCVVVEAEQTIEYLATELAIQLAGGIFVPVEHNCAAEKIRDFAQRVRAAFIVSSQGIENSISLMEICARAENAAVFCPQSLPKKEDVGEILFSTGTTGREKGIVLTHDNDIALAENAISGVKLKEDNVELILAPFNHSHGLRRYYANMLYGATVVMQSSVMNMKRMFEHFEQYHVNAIDLVPAGLHVLLELSGERLGDYDEQLRYIQFGSAPLRKEDKEKLKRLLPHVKMYNIYGSTESGITLVYEFNQKAEKVNCIGRPACNAELLVVNEEKAPIVSSADNPGFLAFRGRMNMKGYWDDEEETNKAMTEGVVYSNDMGYLDGDGDVILLGRQGDVMNVGGKKVSPMEIENVVNSLEGVADCGCVSIEDKSYGEVPKLFVQMKAGYSFDGRKIRKELMSKLEPYKIPHFIVEIAKIPRTYKGSLQRGKLREM